MASEKGRHAYAIEEVRQQLGGVSRQTVYNEIAAGRLRTFTIGRRRLVSEQALADYIRLRELEARA